MADINAPTIIVNTQQSIETDDFRQRQLLEAQFLKELEIRTQALDPNWGFEVR
jgi:hypothetical protein